MPNSVERKTGEAVGDQFCLTTPPRGKRSVGEAVLGILMFPVSDQIDVVRHNHSLRRRRFSPVLPSTLRHTSDSPVAGGDGLNSPRV